MTPLAASLICLACLTISAASTAQPRSPKVMRMEVTAYCDHGETASGETTRRGIVAADPDVLPLGSVIRVTGLARPHNRTYAVEDTGRKVQGRIIDIFMPSCEAAKEFGRQTARVRVVRFGEAESRR